mgnify:CR=1 FL=1
MSIYGELASGRDYALALIVSVVLRKKTRSQCRQIPQKPIMDESNSTSCCLCHKYVRKDVRKVGIANAKFGQGLLGVVSTLLPFCGILTIRETRRI